MKLFTSKLTSISTMHMSHKKETVSTSRNHTFLLFLKNEHPSNNVISVIEGKYS